MTEKKFYARCGLCNENFATKSGCDAHFRSPKHLRRLTRWYELIEETKSHGFASFDEKVREVLAEEKRSEVVEFT